MILTEIIKIDRSNPEDLRNFLDLQLKIYGDNPSTHNSIAKIQDLVTTTSMLDLYIVKKKIDGNLQVVGRMAVGYNENLKDESGTPYGQIGLMELIEDYHIFIMMMDYAKELLKNQQSILFPIYISTWYPYRFVSKGDDLFSFFLEPLSKEYYADFAKKYGVDNIYSYNSYIDSGLDEIIEKNRSHYNRALENGITFRPLNRSNIDKEIEILYNLTISSFDKNLFYAEISFEEFRNLYSGSINILDPELFTFALNKAGEVVGFAFSIPDYTPLINRYDMSSLINKIKFYFNRKKVKGFIIKSTSVISEYRKFGIQAAIFYLHTLEAKRRGYDYVIGALIADGNVSSKVLSDKLIGKDYELYKININR